MPMPVTHKSFSKTSVFTRPHKDAEPPFSKTSVFARPHKDAEPPFSKTSTLESVFENLRFRRHTPPFSIVLVWTEGENGKKVCVFKRKRISVYGALVCFAVFYGFFALRKTVWSGLSRPLFPREARGCDGFFSPTLKTFFSASFAVQDSFFLKFGFAGLFSVFGLLLPSHF